MAEILIKAIEVPHFDPANIAPGWYRPGDPVVVMPDGHPWGLEEQLPKFWVLRMPEVPVEELKGFLLEEVEDQANPEAPKLLLRRRRMLAEARVPPPILGVLKSTGRAALFVPTAQARQYFEAKV